VYVQGNPHHLHEYVPDELRAALAEHFAHLDLRRQHDWTTSALLDDAQAAADDVAAALDVRVAKIFGEPPGTETYTVALASRAPLPAVPAVAVLGAATEPRAWLEEITRLRNELGLKDPLIASLTDERDRARADVATLQDIEARLQAHHQTLLAQIEGLRGTLVSIRRSTVWRLTRPLRVAERLLRERRLRPR
jgi:hypothetical protein